MGRYPRFLVVLAMVGLFAGNAQADKVKFVWSIEITGMPEEILLYNRTLEEGQTFRWQDVEIPATYQAIASDYWGALGNSSLTVSEDAIHQDITIKITILYGITEMFGYSVAMTLQFDVYDGIVPDNSVEGLTLLNPPGTHFYFDCSDGLVLYFDLSPEFEAKFLTPLELTRKDLTLAFAENGQFTWGGIAVTPTIEGDLTTGLTGEFAWLSRVVIVQESAVTPTALERSTWAKIKSLYR